MSRVWSWIKSLPARWYAWGHTSDLASWISHAVIAFLMAVPFGLVGEANMGVTWSLGAFFYREVTDGIKKVRAGKQKGRAALDGFLDYAGPMGAVILFHILFR